MNKSVNQLLCDAKIALSRGTTIMSILMDDYVPCECDPVKVLNDINRKSYCEYTDEDKRFYNWITHTNEVTQLISIIDDYRASVGDALEKLEEALNTSVAPYAEPLPFSEAHRRLMASLSPDQHKLFLAVESGLIARVMDDIAQDAQIQ